MAEDGKTGDENNGYAVGSQGGKAKLLSWSRRKAKWPRLEGLGERLAPMIDQAHKLIHRWRASDGPKASALIDDSELARHALFVWLPRGPVEPASAGSGERAIFAPFNLITAHADIVAPRQSVMQSEMSS